VKNIRSRRLILLSSAALIFSFAQYSRVKCQVTDQLHTPAKGSPERTAILDVLREEYKSGQGIHVIFQVNHLKVHDGWAWVTCTPLDDSGKPVGELWPSLLHYEKDKWVIKDLVAIAEALNDPVGPMEPSRKYLNEVQKKYPGVPADIFPKARG
jgi:hypothetical protein